ncbi:hypothetical protein B0T13DRAFT_158149 [Neurospora crassa]|nr:hypothetical protein B0T13DRAFT_158149 [Neurospora crassa]
MTLAHLETEAHTTNTLETLGLGCIAATKKFDRRRHEIPNHQKHKEDRSRRVLCFGNCRSPVPFSRATMQEAVGVLGVLDVIFFFPSASFSFMFMFSCTFVSVQAIGCLSVLEVLIAHVPTNCPGSLIAAMSHLDAPECSVGQDLVVTVVVAINMQRNYRPNYLVVPY